MTGLDRGHRLPLKGANGPCPALFDGIIQGAVPPNKANPNYRWPCRSDERTVEGGDLLEERTPRRGTSSGRADALGNVR